MKEIKEVICGCGGKPVEIKTTDTEDQEHGCYIKGCCVKAMQCPSCAMKWLFTYESPEAEWD